jgi:phage recombination protein Bet
MSKSPQANIPTTEKYPWTPEQIKLIRDVVAKGASDDELKLFLYRCKNMGLDPLKPGQIYFIKYGNSPGTIVVGIEGFRTRANTTGKLAGIKRGVLRDEKSRCVGAWAEVFRKDWNEPAREEVSLTEYNTGKGNWNKMPETMIKKVAEAAALRMAFPDELGGVYTNEEMDQAEASKGGVYPDQPGENDGDPNRTQPYIIPFGKFAKRTLEEVNLDDLRSYVDYIEVKAQKEGKPLTGKVLDFMERATDYIVAHEESPLEPGSDLEE